jgi:hypothetical protein
MMCNIQSMCIGTTGLTSFYDPASPTTLGASFAGQLFGTTYRTSILRRLKLCEIGRDFYEHYGDWVYRLIQRCENLQVTADDNVIGQITRAFVRAWKPLQGVENSRTHLLQTSAVDIGGNDP